MAQVSSVPHQATEMGKTRCPRPAPMPRVSGFMSSLGRGEGLGTLRLLQGPRQRADPCECGTDLTAAPLPGWKRTGACHFPRAPPSNSFTRGQKRKLFDQSVKCTFAWSLVPPCLHPCLCVLLMSPSRGGVQLAMSAPPPAVGLAPLGGPFSRGFTWGLTWRTDPSEGGQGTSQWTGWVHPHRHACRARGRAGRSWAPQAPQAARQSADACSLCMAHTMSAPDFFNLRARTRVFQVSALPGGRATGHQNALCRLRGPPPAAGEGGQKACSSVPPRGCWQPRGHDSTQRQQAGLSQGASCSQWLQAPGSQEERSWEKQGPLPRAGVVLGEATLFSGGPRG